GLFGILNEHDASGLLDRFHADGAVRSGARQNYGTAVTCPFGQGAEKEIDRRAVTARFGEADRGNFVIGYPELAVQRNHVDMIGLQRGGRRHLLDGKRRMWRE